MSIIYEALKKMQNGPQDESNLPPKPTSIPATVKPRTMFLGMRRSFVLALTVITAGILIARLITNKPEGQCLPAGRQGAASDQPEGSGWASDSPTHSRSHKPTAQSSHKKIYPAAGTTPLREQTRSAKEKLSAQETPELILNGIVLSLDGNLALINEEILKVGDDIRGAKVEEIIDQQVTLTLQGKKIILKKR